MSKHDVALAGANFVLCELGDKIKLAALLQENLQPYVAGRLQVDSCAIEQFHFKPGGGLRLLFTTTLRRDDEIECHKQTYFGLLVRPECGCTNQPVDLEKLVKPKYGPPVLTIPELSIRFWCYPNDPNLRGLPVLDDSAGILARVQDKPQNFGLDCRPTSLTGQLTKYVAGMRCGYLYRIALNGSASNENSEASVYGKAYRHDEGQRAYSIMTKIWESPACQQGDVLLPRPFSFDSDNEILWQEALCGQPLAKTAGNTENLPELAKEIGRRLARFHSIDLDLPIEKTIAFQIDEMRTTVAGMDEVHPQFAERCRSLEERLKAAAGQLGAEPVTPLHVSFKFSHVFTTPKGVAFIDFDGASRGDPAYDVGRFLAHLYKMKVGWKIDPEVAEATATSFCRSYNEFAVEPLSQEHIDWFTASHLLSSQVYKSIKRLDGAQVNKLLKVAERLCPA